jgi:signal transduction histidine kinase
VIGRRLRVLLVEDSPDDASLLLITLKQGGLTVDAHRADNADDTAAALADGEWDLVIADFSMPGFSGVAALELVRAVDANVPFVFVSGTMGEEAAVRAMKLGANDYFMKGNLGRLCPAIERELRDAASRRQRQLAERALVDSETRYRELFQANPHPMWVHDVDTGRVLAANEAATQAYGYAADEFFRLTMADLVGVSPPGGEPASPALPRAERHRRKDGGAIDVEVSALDIRFADAPARLVVATDVTKRRQLESQLHQSQKMQAVGQLAGGIAHDFNNVLSIILGFGSVVLASLEPDDPNHESVAQMVQAGERAALLTRQLLAFSRKQRVVPRILDLTEVLRDMKAMVGRLVGEDVLVELRPAPEQCRVRIDPAQMQQVVMNLVVNARDAMPLGGRLTLETSTAWLDEAFARQHVGVSPGPHALLTVADTGTGIPPDVLPRIFEPFFTTKDVNRGTGLGLATVYAIVSGAGGLVQAVSEVGSGATFKVFLPSADGVPDDLASRQTSPARGNGERILVVEDEPGVRDLVQRALEPLGYTVFVARDPVEGYERAAALGDELGLLITDVVMPRGSGPELARRLLATRPSLRVLYISGYTTDAVAERGGPHEGGAFLAKPFTAPALAHAVRAILDGPAATGRSSS